MCVVRSFVHHMMMSIYKSLGVPEEGDREFVIEGRLWCIVSDNGS